MLLTQCGRLGLVQELVTPGRGRSCFGPRVRARAVRFRVYAFPSRPVKFFLAYPASIRLQWADATEAKAEPSGYTRSPAPPCETWRGGPCKESHGRTAHRDSQQGRAGAVVAGREESEDFMKPRKPPSGRLYSQEFIRDFMTPPTEPAPKPKRNASKKKQTTTKGRKVVVARKVGKAKAKKVKRKP